MGQVGLKSQESKVTRSSLVWDIIIADVYPSTLPLSSGKKKSTAKQDYEWNGWKYKPRDL